MRHIENFLEAMFRLFMDGWLIVILGYYVLFLVLAIFCYDNKKRAIFKDGKVQLRKLGSFLAEAWLIPTAFVVIGALGAMILSAGTDECHPYLLCRGHVHILLF